MEMFESLGVPLKVERGSRVFPVSDKAVDIVDALVKNAVQSGAKIIHERVSSLLIEEGRVFGAEFESGGKFLADSVIVATGGVSYPLTGSTGDGYQMARALGHTIIEPRGSLVPLVEKGHSCAAMQGLALKNVNVKLLDAKGKCVFEEFGELLFTHL